jgi:hypothetical protein
MRSIFNGIAAMSAFAVLAVSPVGATVPITDGSGWNVFYFLNTGSTFQDLSGNPLVFSFTLTQPDVLRVTDGYDSGDQFYVGVQDLTNYTSSALYTSTPTPFAAYVGDCWDCAYFDPAYNSVFSTGSVTLGPGSYLVTGYVALSLEGYGAGALEVGGAAPVPEPATWAMLLLGFAVLGSAGYRASRKAVSMAA